MKFLITGGCGFVGSHLAEDLVATGHHVIVLDDLSTGWLRKHRPPGKSTRAWSLVVGSVLDARPGRRDHPSLRRHFPTSPRPSASSSSWNAPWRPSRPSSRAPTSSSAVPPATASVSCSPRRRRCTASPPTSPSARTATALEGPTNRHRWAYACAKSLDEFPGGCGAHWKQSRLPVVVTRLFNTVGPPADGPVRDGHPHVHQQGPGPRAPHRTRRRLAVALFLPRPGRGQSCSPALIHCPEAVGQVVNVGSQEEVTILRLAELVNELTGNKKQGISLHPVRGSLRGRVRGHGPPPMPCLDGRPAAALIRWAPKFTLRQILGETIAFARKKGSPPKGIGSSGMKSPPRDRGGKGGKITPPHRKNPPVAAASTSAPSRSRLDAATAAPGVVAERRRRAGSVASSPIARAAASASPGGTPRASWPAVNSSAAPCRRSRQPPSPGHTPSPPTMVRPNGSGRVLAREPPRQGRGRSRPAPAETGRSPASFRRAGTGPARAARPRTTATRRCGRSARRPRRSEPYAPVSCRAARVAASRNTSCPFQRAKVATSPTRTTSGPPGGSPARRSSHAPSPGRGENSSVSMALHTTATGMPGRTRLASSPTAPRDGHGPDAGAEAYRSSPGHQWPKAEEVAHVPHDQRAAQPGEAGQQVELDAVGMDHVGPQPLPHEPPQPAPVLAGRDERAGAPAGQRRQGAPPARAAQPEIAEAPHRVRHRQDRHGRRRVVWPDRRGAGRGDQQPATRPPARPAAARPAGRAGCRASAPPISPATFRKRDPQHLGHPPSRAEAVAGAAEVGQDQQRPAPASGPRRGVVAASSKRRQQFPRRLRRGCAEVLPDVAPGRARRRPAAVQRPPQPGPPTGR